MRRMRGNAWCLPAGAPHSARRFRRAATRRPGMRSRQPGPRRRNRGMAPRHSLGMAHRAAPSRRSGRMGEAEAGRRRKGRSPPPGEPARRNGCKTTPRGSHTLGNAWPSPASAIGRPGRTSLRSGGRRHLPRRSPARMRDTGRFQVEEGRSSPEPAGRKFQSSRRKRTRRARPLKGL